MNEEEASTISLMQRELDAERIKRMDVENRYSQDSNLLNNNQSNIVEFQLNLQDELDRIYHLLKGDILERDENGNELWQEPKDDRLKILSDYGVKQLMNIIHFYINKNTLLSNYDEETIYWKVRDFGMEVADLIFNRYEMFFYFPTPEELYNKVEKIIKSNPDKYSSVLIYYKDGSIQIDSTKLYNKCIQWSKEEMQSKLRHYPIIVMSLVDSIHSTYLRAMNGEERASLRRNTNIHATYDNRQQDNTQSKFRLSSPSTWAR